jgi:hypothetical protein
VADELVLAVTLFVLGAPVWEAFWWQAQRWSHDPVELRSVSRRVYLAVLFGLAAAVAMIGTLGLLIVTFEDVTRDRFGARTFDDARIPIGLVLTSVVVSIYHWWVARCDRRLAPPIDLREGPLREITLVALDGRAERAALAEALGRPVRLLHPVDRRARQPRPPAELGPAASGPSRAVESGELTTVTATAPVDPAELDVDVEAPVPAAQGGAVDALIEAVRSSEHSRLLILLRPDGSCEVLPVVED